MTQKVYVVMGNDFPAAVFDSGSAAEAYCLERKKQDETAAAGTRRLSRIYWRVYDFPLQQGDEQ